MQGKNVRSRGALFFYKPESMIESNGKPFKKRGDFFHGRIRQRTFQGSGT